MTNEFYPGRKVYTCRRLRTYSRHPYLTLAGPLKVYLDITTSLLLTPSAEAGSPPQRRHSAAHRDKDDKQFLSWEEFVRRSPDLDLGYLKLVPNELNTPVPLEFAKTPVQPVLSTFKPVRNENHKIPLSLSKTSVSRILPDPPSRVLPDGSKQSIRRQIERGHSSSSESGKSCSHCRVTISTPLRNDPSTMKPLCNACKLQQCPYGQPRPFKRNEVYTRSEHPKSEPTKSEERQAERKSLRQTKRFEGLQSRESMFVPASPLSSPVCPSPPPARSTSRNRRDKYKSRSSINRSPNPQPITASQRNSLMSQPAKYTCQVFHKYKPPALVSYKSFPFFILRRGEFYDILQDAGRLSIHLGLLLEIDDEDYLLLCRDQTGSVGWALASYLTPSSPGS